MEGRAGEVSGGEQARRQGDRQVERKDVAIRARNAQRFASSGQLRRDLSACDPKLRDEVVVTDIPQQTNAVVETFLDGLIALGTRTRGLVRRTRRPAASLAAPRRFGEPSFAFDDVEERVTERPFESAQGVSRILSKIVHRNDSRPQGGSARVPLTVRKVADGLM